MNGKGISGRTASTVSRGRANAPVGHRKIETMRGLDGEKVKTNQRQTDRKQWKDSNRGSADRRGRSNARLSKKQHTESGRTYILPLAWWSIAPIYVFTAVIYSLLSGTVPPPLALAGFLLAAALALVSKPFTKWERAEARDPVLTMILGGLITVTPALLFGSALAHGFFYGGMNGLLAAGAIISISAIAAVLLSGRATVMFVWKIAIWLPFVVYSQNPTAFAGIVMFAILSVIVARYQNRIDRERAERNLADTRVRNRAVDILREYEETGQGWFWETDRRGLLTYLSEPIAEHLGVEVSQLLGRPILELFEMGNDSREGERSVNFHLSARSGFQELAVRAAGKKEERWWSISGRPIYDSFKNFCGFRGSGTDLTEKKRSQEHAARLAHFDSLTGLANRFQMSQTLERILASPKEGNRECSVFLLDLDRFKNVNDTLGHPAGDALLKQVSQRLEVTVSDKGRVGRLGGDEFQIVLHGRKSTKVLAQLAEDIIRALSQPYSIEGQRIVIGASIGIAVCPDNGTDIDLLIRNADLALYAAKDGGRGRYHFYAKILHSAAEERNQLEQDLRDAIETDALELHYQPVVEAASETITGFEALIRWHHAEQGWISPGKFIPIAEDTGLIQEVGTWALRRACQDMAKWPENIRCAINVSPLQFSNPVLPEIVNAAMIASNITPSRIELEITESVFLSDNENTDAMFAALKKLGVRLALDDFGTGYSSLGYLKSAPFDKIKIDQSFVRGATRPGSRNGAIIASITSLALALDMDTIAEGVETLDELDLVRTHGCSHIQGYIYDKPLSFSDATQRLQEGLTAIASGPRSTRAKRHKMLRKIVLECSGQYYNGTVRNISSTGALVEGLWNVPAGTLFRLALSETLIVSGTSRWSNNDRTGIEFAKTLELDGKGAIAGQKTDSQFAISRRVRKSA